MTPRSRQIVGRAGRAGWISAWVASLAAPFLTHAALATGQYRVAAAGFAAVQVTMIGIVAIRQAAGRMRGYAAALVVLCVVVLCLAAILARFAAPGAVAQPSLVAAAALSHAALYGSLLAVFSSSLQPGCVPLVTALARRLRGPLSAAVTRYTRQVTWMWCGYFTAQIAVSAALLALAPVTAWSLFVNVLDAPLLITVFALEFVVRCLRFRNERHFSPIATFRSFARGPDLPASDRPASALPADGP